MSTESAAAAWSVAKARARIQENTNQLAERYWGREDVAALVSDRTALIDELLMQAWYHHFGNTKDVALCAVGGYGRGELHPHSDIDLLILVKNARKHRDTIEAFLRDVFDLNMEVGHAVRTPKQCQESAAKDITVATALFEYRPLVADDKLIAALVKAMSSKKVWPGDRFFRAKRDEQNARHARFQNVDYNLEPNIKSSPGGLRDYHTAMWVCLRQFGTTDPNALVTMGALTEQERDSLVSGRRFLWWIRFGLHLLAGRKEDRLQFEFQRELAQRLGYADTQARLGVERFMHNYYRHVMALGEVNDILLQRFEEEILGNPNGGSVVPLNERFQVRSDYIEAVHERVFEEHPPALMEMFVLMANRRDVAGVRANTIRLIRDALPLIDDNFLNNKEVNDHFINLLRAPYMLVSTLTRMRRYGVLGRYIPEFGRVIGQMQHDLFHIYTVDAHTMMLIRNLRRFFYRSSEELFPVASHCIKKLPKVELLYIAGLFHDIAKGRGGDHSELGADDVSRFCARHGLSETDTELVKWLVRQHLYMSQVAQSEDIYDPDVVHAFATEVKSERRLDYLYTLTVADINATNPNLWNSYRATLLRHLHGATRRALRRGLESPMDTAMAVEECRESAREKLLATSGTTESDVDAFLGVPNQEFFLRHSPRHIAKVGAKLLSNENDIRVHVANVTPQVEGESVTEVYLYTKDRPGLFGMSTATLDQFGLSVFEARIRTDADGTCFNSYVVLDQKAGKAIPVRDHEALAEKITDSLTKLVAVAEPIPSRNQRMTRQRKQLAYATEVSLTNEDSSDCSTLTIVASDRPGLLAEIGDLFREFAVQVRRARINTLGDRAQNLFEIQDGSGNAFDQQAAYNLENALRQALDHHLQRAL